MTKIITNSSSVPSNDIAGNGTTNSVQNPGLSEDGANLSWNQSEGRWDTSLPEVQSFQDAQGLPWYEKTFGTDIALYLSTSIKGATWQEQRNTDVPLNKSTNNGDNVGMIYDASMNCLIADAESDLRRPTIQSDIDKNTFLDFVGGASGDRLKVRRSQTLLKPFHGTNPMGAIGFWVKMKSGTDGVRQVILNSGAETTANAGILLDRLNTNQLRIIVTYGSAGNSAVSFTSTATLTESDGWTPIRVELNGTGVGKGLIAIDGVQETFDVSAGADIDSTSDLIIASNLAGTTTYDIQIDDLIFLDRVFSAPEKATFESINYNREEIEPTKYEMWDIDLRDNSTVWSDAGKTTNAVNDDPIRVISSKHKSNYGGVIREMTSINDATSPIYKSMEYYGLGGALWDGVDDNLDLSENLFEEKGGEWSFIAVIKNLDNLVGSNYMKGSLYGVVTGRDYPTNDIENGGRAYSVAHPTGSAVSLLDLPKQGDEFNIICYTRSGNIITAYNENLVKISETTNEQWDINKFGEQFNPGFWFDGVLSRVIKIRGLLSDFEMSQKIKEIKEDAYTSEPAQPSYSEQTLLPGASLGSSTPSGTQYSIILVPEKSITVSTMECMVTSGAIGTVYMGVYDSSGSLLASCSASTDTQGVVSSILDSTVDLLRGTIYYLSILEDSGGPNFLSTNIAANTLLGRSRFIVGGGALDADISAHTATTTGFWLRVSS